MSHRECKEFLQIANQFKLGTLETEQPHPLTVNLSQDAKHNLGKAIGSLKLVDTKALGMLESHTPDIARLGEAIHDTLNQNGRVYLCGCGATGRLSISLEVFCRQGLVEAKYKEQFIGFMAGGDAALIKSIENFEDHPEFGARQLKELGFCEGDLLISTTEGGETPFVIGATEAALQYSSRKPWFLYCNPEEQLLEKVERSARVINNPAIVSKSFFAGPMGLSGSTRMQASTVLMAGVGWAISCGGCMNAIQERMTRFCKTWEALDLSSLSQFIEDEANCYLKEEFVLYETSEFGVTVLTDTTERSPTFSLPPFENENVPSDTMGWCYLTIPGSKDSQDAWLHLLKRTPRCLEWEKIRSFTGKQYLQGFYIDGSCLAKRKRKNQGASHYQFVINALEDGFSLGFQKSRLNIHLPGLSRFEHNLVLKLVLNIHSTLIMGRLGRFESSLMTFVKPTNFKLIDRAIRYVQQLSELQGLGKPEYELVAERLFTAKERLKDGEPIVLHLLEDLKQERDHNPL